MSRSGDARTAGCPPHGAAGGRLPRPVEISRSAQRHRTGTWEGRLHHAGKAQEALGEFQKSFKIADPAPGEAASDAPAARSLNPDERVRAWFKICAARLLLDLGRPGEAEPMLRQAIAMSAASVADFPTFGNIHWHMAEAKAVLGQCWPTPVEPTRQIRMYRESLVSYERASELEESRPPTAANC